MKNRYDVVIVGSGICGTSLAFHLAGRGVERVLVLERGELCSGTTSHAPGLVGQLRADPALMRMLRTSVGIYREHGDGAYEAVGSLRAASSLERMVELRTQKAGADAAGLEAELVDVAGALARFPLFDPAGVEGALWIPSDGSADAVALTAALRRRAMAAGVEFRANAVVTGFPDGAVELGDDQIEAGAVVLATGIWSGPVGELAGVHLPVVPMQHQVIWTEDLAELNPERPVANFRDPDNLVYFRQHGRKLVAGGYERDPRPFRPGGIPGDSANPTVRGFDPEHFESLLAGARTRVPVLRGEIGFSKQLNGLESFTPDGHFLLGEFPQRQGLWSACGFCAHGVSGSAGVGKFLADWIVDGRAPFDVPEMDVARVQDAPMSFDEAAEAVCGIYSTYYDIARSV